MSSREDGGEAQSSSSSPSSSTPSAQLRAIRARQAAAEATGSARLGLATVGQESDDSSDEEERRQQMQAHAQTHNPVDSLLPSPPRSPPRAIASSLSDGLHARPSSHRPGKTVTVADIRNRSCWICSDGDEGVAEAQLSRRWVHPCKCSLIAHETCLLTWIRSRRTSGTPDPNKPITCPQCSHPYTIVERKPLALQLFEMGDGILRGIVPVAGAGMVGGGVLVAATAYGCTAIRLWMGEKAARRTLGGRWPWHFYFDIALIPFALILSRLRFLDRAMMWLPTAVAFPLTQVPFTTASLSWTHPYAPTWTWRHPRGQATSSRLYPPGPALTILLVPWIRVLYLTLKRKITRRVLSPFLHRSSQATSAGAQRRRSATRRRVIVLGAENQLVDAGVGDVGVDAEGRAREVPPGADAVDDDAQVDVDNEGGMEGEEQAHQQTIYVTPQSLARLCLGALSTPLIANVMGKLLAKMAGWSFWLRTLLGMPLKPAVKSFGLSLTAFDRPAPSSSRRSPLANLLSSGSSYQEDTLEEERQLYTTYDDLDPVWFRNALGAGLFIVVKDALQLSFRYLRLNHARQGSKRTKIVDRPFEGTMVDELELRDDVGRGRAPTAM